MQLNDVFTPRELMQLKYARGGKTHSLKFQKVDFPTLESRGHSYATRHKVMNTFLLLTNTLPLIPKRNMVDAEFGGKLVHLYVRDKDGKAG